VQVRKKIRQGACKKKILVGGAGFEPATLPIASLPSLYKYCNYVVKFDPNKIKMRCEGLDPRPLQSPVAA
jgi:hypothetical protein